MLGPGKVRRRTGPSKAWFALGELHGRLTPRVQELAAILNPSQWDRLIERLGEIENPAVPLNPSNSALRVNPTGTD